MVTTKVRIKMQGDYAPIVPIFVPDLDAVIEFAFKLHADGKAWEGEAFGWQAEYTPESRKKPAGSEMRFTPAIFWIGESGIWFFSLMWEYGKNKEPTEFLDDRGIIKKQ